MLNKAFDIYFFFFFSSKKTQTADTSSVDETLILVGTNFVTGPVTLIQNYSLLKLVIIQSSMHLRQIQKGTNWQQLYIFASKNVLHIVSTLSLLHLVQPQNFFVHRNGNDSLQRDIWTALEHQNLDYDLYNLLLCART